MAVAVVEEADPFEVELRYSPEKPEPPQLAFHLLDELGVYEALYGGAAGGGKSSALLQSALRYVHVPGYSALLLRRTYPDLALPGAIMDRAKRWLIGKPGVKWSERDFRFTFDTGGRQPATLSFGYLQYANDRYRYQGAEFQFVGFDELTQFAREDYTYLSSRIRGPELNDNTPPELRAELELLAQVPLRLRAASNPGGRGHEWVKRRFIEKEPEPDDPEDTPERVAARAFIPARLDDNPHIDRERYAREQLANLTVVERARLRDGDWTADDGSKYFPAAGIDVAVELGDELERMAARGTVPPPAGGLLALGIDWGDRTHYLYGWPLEAGGLWVVRGEELEGFEPGGATKRIIAALGTVPAWPALGTVKNPLTLLSDVRYDAAGLSSQRTFNAIARRRCPGLKATKVRFGARVDAENAKGYKRETALYLKVLLERAEAGHSTRVLALSRHAADLIRQLRALRKDDKDPELWVKEDDHGPDALVALAAPIAKTNRARR